MKKVRIRSPTGREILLKPGPHPNAGIRAEYNRRLQAELDAMGDNILRELAKSYAPMDLAQDGLADDLLETMQKLGRKWLKRFDKGSKKLAEWFAQEVKNYNDIALKNILREAGFSVKFQVTKGMREAFYLTINENIALIRNVPAQLLNRVTSIVNQSAMAGRDMKQATIDIKNEMGISQRRAALIVRDQNNKATAVFRRTRQLELGITDAIWIHTHSAAKPRPEHLQAGNEKRRFKVAEGCFLEHKWVWPGTEINCGCIDRSIIPALDDD